MADDDPDAMVTDAGTVRSPLLLESAIAAPPMEAALESVTVQVAEAPVPRLVGEQDSELTTAAGATRDIDVVCEPPL